MYVSPSSRQSGIQVDIEKVGYEPTIWQLAINHSTIWVAK